MHTNQRRIRFTVDGFTEAVGGLRVSGWNCGGHLAVGDRFTAAVRFEPPPTGTRKVALIVDRIREPGRDVSELSPGANAELTLRMDAPCQLQLGEILTNQPPA